MKRTDQERIDRELRRQRKKARISDKIEERKDLSAGGYAKEMLGLLDYDAEEIFNNAEDEDLLEIVLEMKENLPEKQWEPVLRKAIRLTKVEQKQKAFDRLRPLLEL